MNTVTAATSALEVKTTAARQDKAKGNAGEFADMLSGALKSKQASTKMESDAVKEPDARPQAAGKEQKPAKTEGAKDAAKTEEIKDAAETDKKTGIDEESAAAAAQASANPQPEHKAETPAEAGGEAVAMPVQAARVQRVYAKTDEAMTQTTETAVKADAGTQQAAKQTQATHEDQAAPTAVTNAYGASGTAAQPAETKAANAVKKAQSGTQQVTAQTNTTASETTASVKVETQQSANAETADVNNAGESVGTTRQVEPEAAQKPETAEPPTKFDEMLAKASQELGKDKAATPGEETHETAAKDESGENVPVKTQGTQPQQSAARATVQNAAEVPKAEQAPLKEMPKTDELTLGLVQPAAEEISQPEPMKPVQQAPAANPVKVPEQAEQIRTEVIRSMEDGKMEFNMQLKPQELGTVDVKMVLESGKLAVEIVAANSKSTELLSKQVEALVASLKANNIDVSSVNVVTASQNTSGSMDGAYNLNNFQNQSGRQGGRTHNGQNSAGGAEDDGQQEQEAKQGPQSILNYSV